MRFKVQVFIALTIGGLGLIGFLLPILGFIFLGLGLIVGVDTVAEKKGRKFRFHFPITVAKRSSDSDDGGGLETEKLEGGAQLEFYETRSDLVNATGGLTNELREVQSASVAFESGGFFTTVDQALIRRIDRMILLDPECDFLHTVASMQGSSRDSYAVRITEATKLAISLGIKIRWSEKPILNMVLGYRESGNDWVRVQHQVPHKQAAYWPNIKLDSKRHSKAYSTYREEFERMWGDAKQPPSEFYPPTGQVGVSVGKDGPVLALSDPYLVEDQTADVIRYNGDRLHVDMISLWRIDLTNEVAGTEATEVRVTVDSEPHLSLLPVNLHKMHDNNPPYIETHRIAYGETIVFDFLGRQSTSGMILVYRADSGDQFYVWQLPTDETASQLAKDGIKFKVGAFGAAPTKAVERWFMVKADPYGSMLFLTSLEA